MKRRYLGQPKGNSPSPTKPKANAQPSDLQDVPGTRQLVTGGIGGMITTGMYFRTVYPILGAYAEYFTIVRFYRILIKISRIHKYATTIWAGCVFSRVIACYPTVWREVMSKDKKLERCLRQLVKLGKRSGGAMLPTRQ